MSKIKTFFKKIIPASYSKVEEEGARLQKQIEKNMKQMEKLIVQIETNTKAIVNLQTVCKKDLDEIKISCKEESHACIKILQNLQQSSTSNLAAIKDIAAAQTSCTKDISAMQAAILKDIAAMQTALSRDIAVNKTGIQSLQQSAEMNLATIKDTLTTKTEKTNSILIHQYEDLKQTLGHAAEILQTLEQE